MWACTNPIKSLWRRISLEFLVEVERQSVRVYIACRKYVSKAISRHAECDVMQPPAVDLHGGHILKHTTAARQSVAAAKSALALAWCKQQTCPTCDEGCGGM